VKVLVEECQRKKFWRYPVFRGGDLEERTMPELNGSGRFQKEESAESIGARPVVAIRPSPATLPADLPLVDPTVNQILVLGFRAVSGVEIVSMEDEKAMSVPHRILAARNS
jgi:hypothetical protein